MRIRLGKWLQGDALSKGFGIRTKVRLKYQYP